MDQATNHLLAALSPGAWDRLLPTLEMVALRPGQVLHEPGAPMLHAYFPVLGTVSLECDTESGAAVELAMVGREGVVGVESFLGGGSVPHRAVVAAQGRAYRLPVRAMRQEFGRAGSAMQLMLLYTSALITQIAQTAVCNRHHPLKQRLCRWLLMTLDRIEGTDLAMTHARIAGILGVRREGVTEAAVDLHNAGVIRNSRGRIEVLQRQGLEARTCECYAAIKSEYGRLLPGPSNACARTPDPAGMAAHRDPPPASCAGDEPSWAGTMDVFTKLIPDTPDEAGSWDVGDRSDWQCRC